MEVRELTCIGCPLGCQLTVTMGNDEIKVEGNTCPRGEAYAKKEVTNPTRIVTSTVRVSRGRLRHVSASRECASSRSIFGFIGRISYETKNLQSIRMRITFLIQTNWRFSISPGLPLGFIYHLFLAL